MIDKIINLETKIVSNKQYLGEYCPHVETILEQITMILDHGLDAHSMKEWYKLNKASLRTIDDLLEKKMKNLC